MIVHLCSNTQIYASGWWMSLELLMSSDLEMRVLLLSDEWQKIRSSMSPLMICEEENSVDAPDETG